MAIVASITIRFPHRRLAAFRALVWALERLWRARLVSQARAQAVCERAAKWVANGMRVVE